MKSSAPGKIAHGVGEMAARPKWLQELSSGFMRHRHGRAGWFVELTGDRLRVRSTELPPRPEEPPEAPPKRRDVWLNAPPGPGQFQAELGQMKYPLVMAGHAPLVIHPGK